MCVYISRESTHRRFDSALLLASRLFLCRLCDGRSLEENLLDVVTPLSLRAEKGVAWGKETNEQALVCLSNK